MRDVAAVLKDACAAAETQHVVGFLAYEAAAALDSACVTHEPAAGLPLAWFGVFGPPETHDELPGCGDEEPCLGEWVASVSREEYDASLDRIRSFLLEGDTYQVNYSFRLRSPFSASPYALFHALQRSQQARHSVFIETDAFAIASASPELFFELDGDRLRSRPMKGTAARGLTYAQDLQAGDLLRESGKNRAENIMIVDMIRNDLGRIANAGSVRPVSLFDIERYPTVLQMTSTVEAKSDASLYQVMRAMFPCASVTGAPKIRTMQIIKQLESSPRGVYTGCVGMMGPGRQASFNVAIRTVSVDKHARQAEYGVGGGIVWDSVNASEYAECLTKAAVLTRVVPEFDLLETLLWEPDAGFFLLEVHLDRLRNSAHYFGFKMDHHAIQQRLHETAVRFTTSAKRVRLLLARDGELRLEHADASIPVAPLSVVLAEDPIDASDPFLYHKTTHRVVYERARQARPGADDVILYNERGEVTEFTSANLVIERDGQRVTPPVECGLLGGTFRQVLLDRNEITESIITIDDLKSADKITLINSVRRCVEVLLS
ncbi:MAG: aminodeoxychorismate synthase component I [Verrucomicrobia bacterium]|nr:aminodeoxychorismate synthase component I [Verrucomicrobiota bacterium]MDA1088134.1 aminodeoxychorismate synthase component I [Verrucomicrobiota bacterium]